MSTEVMEGILMVVMFMIAIFASVAFVRAAIMARKTAQHTKKPRLVEWIPYVFVIIFFSNDMLDEEGILYRREYIKSLVYLLVSIAFGFVILTSGIEMLKAAGV